MGVIKSALAAKAIAIKKGIGFTPKETDREMAMGVNSAAVALLDITPVKTVVIKYKTDIKRVGPKLSPTLSTSQLAKMAESPLDCMASPMLKAPAKSTITFQSMEL